MPGDFEQRRFARDAPPDPVISELMAQVGRVLHEQQDIVIGHVDLTISDGVDRLSDPESAQLLHRSVEANVAMIVHALRHRLPVEELDAGPAAHAYAQYLASAGVPSIALRRAYHFGSDDALAFMFEAVETLSAPGDVKLRLLHHLAGWLHHYIDRITIQVLQTFDEEKQRLAASRAYRIAALVQTVLDGATVDHTEFFQRSGYRLDQQHLAIALWVDGANAGMDHTQRLDDLTRPIAQRVGGSTDRLFSAVDRTSGRAWFGAPNLDVDHVVAELHALTVEADLHIAVGDSGRGSRGFARSLEQAQSAGRLLYASGHQRMIAYGQESVPVLAELVGDLPTLRGWTRETLGGLARDTETAAMLRQTLTTHLCAGSSLVATAGLLHVHRNTVSYRLRQAERERGAPLTHHGTDLALALNAWDLLGSVLLEPPDTSS